MTDGQKDIAMMKIKIAGLERNVTTLEKQMKIIETFLQNVAKLKV